MLSKKNIYAYFCKKLIKTETYNYIYVFILTKLNVMMKSSKLKN